MMLMRYENDNNRNNRQLMVTQITFSLIDDLHGISLTAQIGTEAHLPPLLRAVLHLQPESVGIVVDPEGQPIGL